MNLKVIGMTHLYGLFIDLQVFQIKFGTFMANHMNNMLVQL